jgi:AbrB family looped-hinge helix DNA binding protein
MNSRSRRLSIANSTKDASPDRAGLETILSTKGQIVLPSELRETLGLKPGARFLIEERDGGILLRPRPVKTKTLEALRGCINYAGRAVSFEEMDSAIMAEAARRNRRSCEKE